MTEKNNLLDFMIIGSQKAATTFIHKCLLDHPEVFMPINEVPYFEDPDYNETADYRFLQLFSSATSNQKVGIKRPSYLHKPECPSRIKRDLPNVNLIVVLRNPIDRLISAYFHYMKFGFFPVVDINDGIPRLLNGDFKDKWPRSKEIIEFSYYYKSLNRYFELFDKNKILVIFQEDITKDKNQIVSKVYDFIKVKNSYIPQYINHNPKKAIYSIPRLKLLTKRNKYLYSYYYNNTRLKIIENPNPVIELCSRTISGFDRMFFSKILSNKKPMLNSINKKDLLKLYTNDISNTESLLNVDLSLWKQ